MKKTFQVVIVALSVVSAWGKPTVHPRHTSQPSSIFTVGPGTVIAIHALDIAFIGRCYTVRYETEQGELIEIRHLRQDIPVLQGMHGVLTYSTNPEMILNFQVIENKTEMRSKP